MSPPYSHIYFTANWVDSHGLAFSLFVVDWVKASGARDTFLVIAGMHLVFLFITVPLYMYGKRVRMWMARGC